MSQRRNPSRQILIWLSAILVPLLACSERKASKPESMPVGSIRISGIKGTSIWQACWATSISITCRISNGLGEVFVEDEFVPYAGVVPKSQSDLKIDPTGGTEWVHLKNGTTLIPKRNFAEIKGFLDRQTHEGDPGR